MGHKPTFSFEFFPPKSEKAEKALWETITELADMGPKFMTVTYGAGGSTKDGTEKTVLKMQEETGIPIAAHLTYINTTKAELQALTDSWWQSGIKHIVALRGDLTDDLSWPLDPHKDYFQHTSVFVKELASWNDFELSVGCYPEKHPKSPSIKADVEALKRKCDAGADRAITQFFFENEAFYDFVNHCRAAGIDTPICPGLLPIHDFTRMCAFAEKCDARVPDWLKKRFDGLEDNPGKAEKVAADLLVTQVLDLAAHDVEHIHFYTLNKTAITKAACQALNNL